MAKAGGIGGRGTVGIRAALMVAIVAGTTLVAVPASSEPTEAVVGCGGEWERRESCELAWMGGHIRAGAISTENPNSALWIELYRGDVEAAFCLASAPVPRTDVWAVQCDLDPSGLFDIEMGDTLTCIVHGHDDAAGRGVFGCQNTPR